MFRERNVIGIHLEGELTVDITSVLAWTPQIEMALHSVVVIQMAATGPFENHSP